MQIKYRSNAYFVETPRRIWWSGDNYSEPNTEDEIFFELIFAHTENGAKTVFRRARICPYEYEASDLRVQLIAGHVNRPIGIASEDDELWEDIWVLIYDREKRGR